MSSLRRLLAGALVVCGIACTVLAGGEKPPRDRDTANTLAPPGNYAYIGQFVLWWTDMDDLVEKTGAAPPIVFYMVDWIPFEQGEWLKDPKGDPPLRVVDSEFLDELRRLHEQGSVPALGWGLPLVWLDVPFEKVADAPNIPRLLRGDYDEFIAANARQIAKLELPVMMTFLPEFNNYGCSSFGTDGFGLPEHGDVPDLVGAYGDPAWPDGPERVRDAVVRVIDIFRREGANNVSWFMYANTGYMVDVTEADTGDNEWWSHPKYYYPGDEYIDWVGKSLHFTDIEWLPRLLDPAYEAWGTVTGRPFFSPEFSFHEGAMDRSGMFREVFLEYLPSRPRFRAAALYHSPLDVAMGFGWGVPLGGREGEFPEEVETWGEVVVDNPYCRPRLAGMRPSAGDD